MKIRYASTLLFAVSCASTVTQNPPRDTVSIGDAGTDTDAAVPDAGNLAIGRPCKADGDCGGGQLRCDSSVPNGYCTYMCSGNLGCPKGSVCSPLPVSRISGLCMQSCTKTSECRTGYVCDLVYLFPGDPNAPVSPSPVCWEPPPSP